MAEQAEQVDFDVTDDDKLWAALAYVFSPLIPVIMLLMDDKKDPSLHQGAQCSGVDLGPGSFDHLFGSCGHLVGVCTGFIGWGIAIYWGVKAYQGEMVNIPVITDFVKN